MKGLDGIRTDVVGSLLRPDALAHARLRYERGEIGDGEFRAAENEAVDRAIRLQEQIGLDVVTDGEFRRLNFQDSFGEAVSGYDRGGRRSISTTSAPRAPSRSSASTFR